MSYSILYKGEKGKANPDLIYDLSIDRAVSNFSDDQRKNEYFCHILSAPLSSVEEIEYRREILKDLVAAQGLFEELRTQFNRYDRIKADWLELKSNNGICNADRGSEAMLEYIYSSLKVTALFPKMIHSFFTSISDTLSASQISSQGLTELRDRTRELSTSDIVKRIVDISGNFMYNNYDDYDFELVCRLGDSMEVVAADICAVTKREKKKNTLLSRLKKSKKGELPIELKSEEAVDEGYRILGEALFTVDKTLEDITNTLYTELYGIARELEFYEIALKYTDFVKTTGKPVCYPEMGQENVYAEELYDLFLLSEAKTRVYPNTADLVGYEGVLIRGKNNTGKTTFLRSVAVAQLFAQAGLPVLAKKCSLPVYNGIYTHFSGAEEDFEVGDTAGRFEGEVKAMASIMDAILPNSLVILNETFQTTAYDEGTEAIYHILRAIKSIGCRFIFVTHLTELFAHFDDSVAKLESVDGQSPFTIKKLKEIRQ